MLYEDVFGGVYGPGNWYRVWGCVGEVGWMCKGQIIMCGACENNGWLIGKISCKLKW